MKKLSEAHQVYNDGLAKFYIKEQAYDPYGTPIPGGTDVLKLSAWFREGGVTAQDTFYAQSLGQELTRKVIIRGKIAIDPKWTVQIESEAYEVYRSYINPKNETEVSLIEVTE